MIRVVRENPWYTMSEWGAEFAFREYVKEHPDIVTVDEAQKHFNFTLAPARENKVATGEEPVEVQSSSPSPVPSKLTLSAIPSAVLAGTRVVEASGDGAVALMQRASDEILSALDAKRWLEASIRTIDLHEQLLDTTAAWLPVYLTLVIGTLSKATNHISLPDKEEMAARFLTRLSAVTRLQAVYQSDEQVSRTASSAIYQTQVSLGLQGVSLAAAALLLEAGTFDESLSSLRHILNVPSYLEVRSGRRLWALQRQLLSRSLQGQLKVHYVTAASSETVELGNLRHSAKLSGIDLTVLGLNRSYSGYHDKLNWYFEYMTSTERPVDDNDVVVLMDAYDVLLFPAARDFGETFQTVSPTPIVFCAESGIYPDFTVAGLYPRGRMDEYFLGSQGLPRFLNSGCIIGRAGQIKAMLGEAQTAGPYYRDDQRWFVLYAITHPHLVSLDVHKRFFVTTHAYRGEMHLSPALRLTVKPSRYDNAIGLMHCNNRGGNKFYDKFAGYLQTRGE